jgi:biotin transport system substrate-specific component
MGPSGGYLLGFLAAAYVAGLLAERGTLRSWPLTALTLIAGNLVLYVPGVLWLGVYTGLDKAVNLGFIPFLAGDALKTVAGVGILMGANLLYKRPGGSAVA